jgi:hypothetical protein
MSERGWIRDAARALRGDLAALELPRANELDRAVADLLAAGKAGADIDDDLLELLREDPRTRAYTEFFVRFGSPPSPEHVKVRGGSTLPGDAGPIPLARYSCPMGDYDWYRRAAGQPLPHCPTHDVPLKRAE